MTRPVIESIKLRDLETFAEVSALEGRTGGVAAISASRARAWQHNPHAEPDDVALLVARVDGECAGYLGLMPGRVRIDGDDERVHWFSTFYVPSQWRDAGVGALLLLRACALGQTLAASGSSEEARRTYPKLGFQVPGSVPYYVLDLLRGNLAGLPFRALRKLASRGGANSRLLDLGVETGARITRGRVLPALQSALAAPRSFHTKTLAGLQDANFERVADERRPVRFLRDGAVIDWMLRHPWVTTNGPEDTPGYYFDDYRDDARHVLVELHDDRGALGFALLWLTTRKGVRDVHLLDHHLDDPADVALLPSVVLRHAREYCADRVYLPDACGAAIEATPLARRLFSRHERLTYLRPGRSASALRSALPELHLDYCDGDIPFA